VHWGPPLDNASKMQASTLGNAPQFPLPSFLPSPLAKILKIKKNERPRRTLLLFNNKVYGWGTRRKQGKKKKEKGRFPGKSNTGFIMGVAIIPGSWDPFPTTPRLHPKRSGVG